MGIVWINENSQHVNFCTPDFQSLALKLTEDVSNITAQMHNLRSKMTLIALINVCKPFMDM